MLRQLYYLEAAKAALKTLAEAKLLVAYLEDGCEFSKAQKEEGSLQKGSKGKVEGNQQGKKKRTIRNDGNSGGNWGKPKQGQ